MKRLFLILFFSVFSAPLAADGISATEPEAIVNGWIETVVSGDAGAVAAILAPEFQIMRGNGIGYTGPEYVDHGMPQAEAPKVSDLIATRSGDILVLRYVLLIDAVIDGQTIQAKAPRLTVFRHTEEGWFVVAHANFALPKD